MKILATVVVVVVLLYVFLAKFSSVETKYACQGEFTNGGVSEEGKVFFRLEAYRPWVGLWSDSDGSMWLEIPNEHVEYFDNLLRVADSYQILESQYSDESGIQGNFSALSNALTLQTYKGFYDGYCEPS